VQQHNACDICRLLGPGENDDLVVSQTPFWRVALASEQVYLGRAYVTARRHVSSVPHLTGEEWLDLRQVWADYEQRVREVCGPAEPFNWGCLLNNTFRETQPQPHVHWHVRPRYALAPTILGRTWPDPNFGYHYRHGVERAVTQAELSQLARMLRAVQ
jgi:diadenosine tetraphosphate (Ap4A) HIT family hydrolase